MLHNIYLRAYLTKYITRGGSVIINHSFWPTCSRNPEVPESLEWPALDPLKGSADSEDGVNRDGNEPKKYFDLAVRDPQQGERERRLAPRCCQDRRKTCRKGAYCYCGEVSRVDVRVGFAVAVADTDGNKCCCP